MFLRNNGLPIKTVVGVGVQRQTPDLIAVFPDIKHIFIEPVRENFRFIHENYAEIDYELLPAAASDRDGETNIRPGKPNASGRIMTLDDSTDAGQINRDRTDYVERAVREVRLDTALPFYKAERPYLLKLDVDGPEERVIAGAIETLKQTSCIVMECPLGKISQRILLLQERGFFLWDIIDLNYYKGNLSHVDMVFVPGWQRHLPALRPWANGPFDPNYMQSYLHEPS